MRRIVAFLKNMKPRTWFFVTLVLFFIFQFALFPEMIKTHYIYAEDGGIFLDGFQKDGVKSFFEPFGGYLVLTSRIFAAISIGVARIFNNFKYSFDMLEILSSLLIAFILAYFASDRFEFLIKKRSRRFIVSSLTLLMMSCFTGMLFGGVGIHWWCGLLMFLVNLELLNDKIPPIYMYPFIVLCVLSSPSALILGFGIIYYVAKKSFVEKAWRKMLNKRTISFLVIAIISLAVQAFVVLFVKKAGGGAEFENSARRMLNTTSASYDMTVGSSLFIFTRAAFTALFSNGVGPIAGGLLWVVMLYLAKKKKMLRFALMALISIFSLYFMTFFKQGVAVYDGLVRTWIDIFYNALPATISMIVVFSVLLQYVKKQHLIIEISLLVALVPHMIMERWRPDNPDLNQVVLNQISKHTEFGSEHYEPFIYGNHPYDIVHIPVDAEFCNEYWVRCGSL